jgi:lactoylglutathione lyase
MTTIDHLAIWTQNLEKLRGFYETYFGAEAGARYVNAERAFESCFLTFSCGARLELMRVPDVAEARNGDTPFAGYAHLAFSVGSRGRVDDLTARLERDGFRLISAPRTTGDGYYESVVSDPDGNRVEITV